VTPTGQALLVGSADPEDRLFGTVVAEMLNDVFTKQGGQWQIFLLSAPDAPETLRMETPITHPEPWAWTQKQRYVRSERLRSNPKTTEGLA